MRRRNLQQQKEQPKVTPKKTNKSTKKKSRTLSGKRDKNKNSQSQEKTDSSKKKSWNEKFESNSTKLYKPAPGDFMMFNGQATDDNEQVIVAMKPIEDNGLAKTTKKTGRKLYPELNNVAE